MPVSHIPRTLKLLRDRGWEVDVCERWIGPASARRRKDLFGLFDLLAFDERGVAGIQVCAGSGHAARAKKMRAEVLMDQWIVSRSRFAAVISWRKSPIRRGSKRLVWTPREEWF